MEEYTILGFSEITPMNINKFVEKVIEVGEEGLLELPQRDLIQVINSFNTFSQFNKNKELWNVLESAVLKVINYTFY